MAAKKRPIHRMTDAEHEAMIHGLANQAIATMEVVDQQPKWLRDMINRWGLPTIHETWRRGYQDERSMEEFLVNMVGCPPL